MDALDLILILVILVSALRGFRRGAAVQVLSYGGALGGLALGVVLVLLICPHVSGQRAKTAVALLLLLVPAAVFAASGRHLGAELWRRLRRARFGAVDAAGGAVVATAGALVVIWLLASILVNSQFSLVASQINDSRIIRSVTNIMPPIPTALAPVERFLSDEGLQLVADGFVQLAGPVAYPSAAQVLAGAAKASPSTVKVVAIGCGEIQEGSGFVVGRDLVVTNAHVVAGTQSVRVEDSVGYHVGAVAYFDPEFDLAILRVHGLPERALTLDPGTVGRGTKAVVLGYPEGGPLAVDPAGVRSEIFATGLDIYGENPTVRAVYVIQALVRPGNSGGPLVEPDGLVIGVVFSRSPTSSDIGYALASPGVLARIHKAESLPTSAVVGTGGCISK
ncbi:MAG: MarP family serine protease [Acidimicrobiales bacterium]|jgi:S1-C subfamily serine protease